MGCAAAAPVISASNPVFPFHLVRADLERVEASILEQARAFDPGVEGYVSYVCKTSGKRIRPALAVLSGLSVGELAQAVRKGTPEQQLHELGDVRVFGCLGLPDDANPRARTSLRDETDRGEHGLGPMAEEGRSSPSLLASDVSLMDDFPIDRS